MVGVNNQLALFFEQVGMRGYLKKSIAVFIMAFFLIIIHMGIMIILMYYIEIDKIYYYMAAWLNAIIFYSLYLAVILIFNFLADFGFEARTY